MAIDEKKPDEGISLREYFDMRIESHMKHNEFQHNTMERAQVLALDSLNKRLEGMNEFRESLKDQSAKFVYKSEYDAEATRLKDDIRILRESKANLEGKADMSSVYIGYAISGIAIILAIIKFFI